MTAMHRTPITTHHRRPAAVVALTWGLLIMIALFSTARAEGLAAGDPAPPFSLLDQDGETRSVEGFAGRWLVLYFYPKDDTPGCTRQACELRDDHLRIRGLGAEVAGVSLDDVASHREFAAKYHLPFPLLSDAGGEVARAYGTLWSLGPVRFAKRHTFILDPEGRIARIYRKVDPATHSDRVIADLEALMAERAAPAGG